jgi:hypothetical protein
VKSTSSAGAAAVDWAAVTYAETVRVLTTDEGGDERSTKIWLLVQDGNGYIRTSRSTTGGDNVERNPAIGLRIDASDYEFRAVFTEDEAERDKIVAGFEEKYGSNPILNWIRGDAPRIMRPDPR